MRQQGFTAKDFDTAFGIGNRELIYMVDRGHIAADIKVDKPRVFSIRQAMTAGFIRYFQDQGFNLERSMRLAKFACAALFFKIKHAHEFHNTPSVSMHIKDGIQGALVITCLHKDMVKETHFKLSFMTTTDVEDDDLEIYMNNSNVEKFDSIYTYNIDNISNKLFGKLIPDGAYISGDHEDKSVIVLQTKDPELALVGIEGDSYLTARKQN